jgi:flagellar hook-basal body complex protein FliE
MVNGIGKGGGLASEAIKAALQRSAEASRRLDEAAMRLDPGSAQADSKPGFRSALTDGIHEIDSQVRLGDELVEKVVSGEITEFHEIAAQIKQADLSFKFAMSVRNKLVDAYREVMRMNV